MSTPHQLIPFRSVHEKREHRASEADLVHALRHEQFLLHFQPQVELHTGEILGMEALLRWNRPGSGLTAPNGFLGSAQESGLIAQIDEWAIGAAARQSAAWHEAGLPPFSIAVNVSTSQFHGEGFVERVTHLLRGAQASASRMEIEITEGVIACDCEAAIEKLEQLHELGISLSIDDFGTGFSSLSYLHRLPVDEIKIDRSFVHQMTRNEGVAGVVRGIVELAHGLKLQVIAEGVETCEQLKHLMDVKCDRAQGDLISRPLPAGQFKRFLAEWSQRWKTMTG